jgi:hypothetical protein
MRKEVIPILCREKVTHIRKYFNHLCTLSCYIETLQVKVRHRIDFLGIQCIKKRFPLIDHGLDGVKKRDITFLSLMLIFKEFDSSEDRHTGIKVGGELSGEGT